MADMTNTMKTILSVDTSQPEKAIARLNTIASDSTEKLEDRIAAKNKAIETQNKLSKKTIKTLKEEISVYEELVKEGKDLVKVTKDLEKTKEKLNKAEVKAEKATATNVKQLNKLNKALEQTSKKTKEAAKAKAESTERAKKAARAQEEHNAKINAEKAALDELSSKRRVANEENLKHQKEVIRLNGIAADTTKTLTERVSAKSEQIKLEKNLSQKKQTEIKAEIEALKKLGGQEKRVEKLTSDLNREQVRFGKSAAQNTKQLNKLSTALSKSNKRVGALSGGFKQMAARFTGAALVAGAFIGTLRGIWRGLKDAAQRVVEFDKTMQEMSGIVRESRADLQGVENTIIEVASKSIKTSNEVAKLAATLFTLGKSKAEVQELLEPVNNLSIAMKASSDEAGEFLVQTLNAFGVGASEAENYANTIAAIRTSTTLDFQKMRDSFQYIAPISKLLNEDLAYTGALVGVLADNGLKAESSGRLLATAQIKLAKEGLTLNQGLAEINALYRQGATDIEIMAKAGTLFGQNAARVGAVLATNTAQISEYRDKIVDSQGALDDLVNNQLESLDAKIKILNSTWEKFILDVDSGTSSFSKASKAIIEFTTEAISSFDDIAVGSPKVWEKTGTSIKTTIKTIFPFIGTLASGLHSVFNVVPKNLGKGFDYIRGIFKTEADIVRTAQKRLDLLNSITEAKKEGLKFDKQSIVEVDKILKSSLKNRRDDEIAEAKEIRDKLISDNKTSVKDREKIDADYLNEKLKAEEKYQDDSVRLELETLEKNISEKEKVGEVTLQEKLVLLDKQQKAELYFAKDTGKSEELIYAEYREKRLEIASTYTDRELQENFDATNDANAKLLEAERKAKEKSFLEAQKFKQKTEDEIAKANKANKAKEKSKEFISDAEEGTKDLSFEKEKRDLGFDKEAQDRIGEFDQNIYEKESDLAIRIRDEKVRRAKEAAEEEFKIATEGLNNKTILAEAENALANRIENEKKAIFSETQEVLNNIANEAQEKEEELKINAAIVVAEEKAAELEEKEAQIEEDEIDYAKKVEEGELDFEREQELKDRKIALIEEIRDAQIEAYNTTTKEADKNSHEVLSIEKEAARKIREIKKIETDSKLESILKVADASIANTAAAFGVEKEAALAISAIRASESMIDVFKGAAAAAKGGNFWKGALFLLKGMGEHVAPIFTQIKAIQKTRMKGVSDNTSAGDAGSIAPTSVNTSVVGDISANNAARLGVDPSITQRAEEQAANRISATSSSSVTFSESRYNDFQKQVAFKEDKTTI